MLWDAPQLIKFINMKNNKYNKYLSSCKKQIVFNWIFFIKVIVVKKKLHLGFTPGKARFRGPYPALEDLEKGTLNPRKAAPLPSPTLLPLRLVLLVGLSSGLVALSLSLSLSLSRIASSCLYRCRIIIIHQRCYFSVCVVEFSLRIYASSKVLVI